MAESRAGSRDLGRLKSSLATATLARSFIVRILLSTTETCVRGGRTVNGLPMAASTLSGFCRADSPSKTTFLTFTPRTSYLSQWILSAAVTCLNSLEGMLSIIVRYMGTETVMRKVCP